MVGETATGKSVGLGLGCDPVVGSLTCSKKREYRVTNRLQEGKRPLYAVIFNFIDSRYFNVFATVGGNRVPPPPLLFLFIPQVSTFLFINAFFNSSFIPQVTVYQCLEGGVIAVLQSYVDEDVCRYTLPSFKLGFHFSRKLFLFLHVFM